MEDHSEQFKTPLDQFSRELDALEDRSNGTNVRDTIARQSLYKQFDPLVAISKSHSPQQTITSGPDTFIEPATSGEEQFNQSSTLIHINTPSAKQFFYEKNIPSDEINTNGHVDSNELFDRNDNSLLTNDNNANMDLLSQMESINEQLFDFVSQQLQSFQQQLAHSQQEEEKLNSKNNILMEDMNNVEKNYYDTHSRYENVRTLVKEIADREAVHKEKILELQSQLKDKDQQCRKWKQVAEETIEKANYQMQNTANKETVSLKAQVKVLEMRVNSLQSQIEQKGKENDELSHILEELIGKKN